MPNELVFTDDELAEQALAADPDQPLPPDAVPFAGEATEFGALLPDWYMPAPSGGVERTPRRRAAATVVIASLLTVNALGLCVTYGALVIPIF